MPVDWTTTIALMIATLAAATATIAAFARLRGRRGTRVVERITTLSVMFIAVGLLIYHAVVIHKTWAPLEAHVDGLFLLIALLTTIISYLQFIGRLRGVDLFLLPVTTLLCAWAICASWWSYQAFTSVEAVWNTLHVVAVYLGMAATAIAAATGALFLYVQHQLKRRDNLAEAFRRLGNLTNLESLDRYVTRSATLGFILLTMAVITGFVIEFSGKRLNGSLYDAKVIGATIGWVVYGLLVHTPFAPALRGRRAAQLAIIGFFVLLVVMGIAVAIPARG